MRCQMLRCKGGFYWRIRTRNGNILCHSEVYTTKRRCRGTAETVAEGMAFENCVVNYKNGRPRKCTLQK